MLFDVNLKNNIFNKIYLLFNFIFCQYNYFHCVGVLGFWGFGVLGVLMICCWLLACCWSLDAQHLHSSSDCLHVVVASCSSSSACVLTGAAALAVRAASLLVDGVSGFVVVCDRSGDGFQYS